MMMMIIAISFAVILIEGKDLNAYLLRLGSHHRKKEPHQWINHSAWTW